MKMPYIMFCLLFGTGPAVSNDQDIQSCIKSAGIAQDIQQIRQEFPEDTYDDFKSKITEWYGKDTSYPVFIILGDYVFKRFSGLEAPQAVHDAIMQDCLSSYKIEKAPPIKEEPIQEFEV